MIEALGSYGLALLLTAGIEAPIVLLLAGKSSRGALLRVVLAANLFTHPLANWAHAEGFLAFLPLEAAVVAAEAAIYAAVAGLRLPRAAAVALLANAATAALSFTI